MTWNITFKYSTHVIFEYVRHGLRNHSFLAKKASAKWSLAVDKKLSTLELQ